ncbi:perlucin-like protein [Mytilus californianus]|uniref:perlucin-like protein n=1 Tax=Mytilus californianus TaxID=6549 RepID=UPI0022461F4C|nr:perlucin-like protein [Mytilus californianus]
MFLSVILVLCCISMIESNSCDISKEKSTIYSMLQSIEKKMKEKCSANSGNCPAGWKKYKDHCYFFSPDTKIWHYAAKQCNNMGGYLVKIEDSAENSWVVSKLYESVKHNYGSWIGMADFKKEGDWRWVHDSDKVRYSQWYPGEPNNNGRNEDCGLLMTVFKYKWNDVRCNLDNTGYICECSHGPNCRPFNG